MFSLLIEARGSDTTKVSRSSRAHLLRSAWIKSLRVCYVTLLTVGLVNGAHAQALSPGSFVGWGEDTFKTNEVPSVSPPLVDVNAISSYSGRTVALRSDGTVVVWGSFASNLSPPEGLKDVTAIASTDLFIMALRRDGSVVFWGDYPEKGPFVPGTLTGVQSIAANVVNAIALKRDGTVIHWSVVDGSPVSGSDLVHDVVAVATGFGYGLGLKRDGTVVGWGDNWAGQIDIPPELKLPALNKVVAVAATRFNGLALKENGSIVVWGPDLLKSVSPAPDQTGFKAIAGGYHHALAITADGEAKAWGLDMFGEASAQPGITNVKSISAGVYNSFALNPAPLLPPYTFSGFQPPVDSSPVINLGKAGRTYPVKWQLKDRSGAFVSALTAVQSVKNFSAQCGAFSNDPTGLLETTSTDDILLRYDTAANQFIYNWKTPSTAGCYTLVLTLDSGDAFTAYFNLTK